MSEWTKEEKTDLTRLLTKVRDQGDQFWPEGEHQDLVNAISALPASEVALSRQNPTTGTWEVLVQYREFSKEPQWSKPPYNVNDWYLPGGYMQWRLSTVGNCIHHLRKDLRNEYRRAKIPFDVDSLSLSAPVLIGGRKWTPGEHPVGCPQSNVYVCTTNHKIVETPWLKWTSAPIPTKVPLHAGFIAGVLFYLNSSFEKKQWLAELHCIIGDV